MPTPRPTIPKVCITAALHQKLKILAAKQGVTMGQLVQSLLDYWEASKEAHS